MKRLNLQKKSRTILSKKVMAAILFFGAIVTAILIWSFNSSSLVFEFAFSKNKLLSNNDRVNVLLLGNAGGRHEGATLTDSIIVASYHLKTNNVLLISLPRDLWIPDANIKVNTLYQTGEDKGEGLKYTKDHISEILGFPIHYSIRLDFNGFAKAVDLIGGLEVFVPNSFDDINFPIEGKEDELCGYKEEERELNEDQIKQLNLPSPAPSDNWLLISYPINLGKNKVLVDPQGNIATDSATLRFDCRYEHIRFNAGLTSMDGETALKFVRSRQGTSGEGSDFARSRRQQLILQSFRSKVLSLETLANPQKIAGLISTLGDSVETDIPFERFLDFYNLTKRVEDVESIVLGNLGDGKSLFINPPLSDYGGAWVLTPVNNDFSQVQEYIKLKLDEQAIEPDTQANL